MSARGHHLRPLKGSRKYILLESVRLIENAVGVHHGKQEVACYLCSADVVRFEQPGPRKVQDSFERGLEISFFHRLRNSTEPGIVRKTFLSRQIPV